MVREALRSGAVEDRRTLPQPARRPPAPSGSRAARLVAWLATVCGVVVAAAGFVGAVVLPLAIVGADNGGYCQSRDHPGPCPSATESVVPGIAAVAAGAAIVAVSRAYLRGRR